MLFKRKKGESKAKAPELKTGEEIGEKHFEGQRPAELLREILRKRQQPEIKHHYPKFRIAPAKFHPLPADAKEAVYPLIRPYAYVSIKHDKKDGTLLYRVVEPQLTEEEKRIFQRLKEGLIQLIDIPLSSIKNEAVLMNLLEEKIAKLLNDYAIRISDDQYLRIMYFVYRDFVGMNELEPLLRDPYIEDISCDGFHIPLYVVHQKFGQIKSNVVFNQDETKLRDFVVKLAERCGRYVSYAEPLLDGTLPDGTRVQASLAGDVTTHGPTFSIRKFKERPFTPTDAVRLGTTDIDMLSYFWFTVEHGANVIIVGATATGKTSFLNTLAFFMPEESKVVSIEDTRELRIEHENWVPAVARLGFAGTKIGEVNMFDLLKEAFRQNPNYLIVGEVRGQEAAVMFQAMASGITSMSTMHAGSAEDALKRLQTPPINMPPTLMETLDIMIIMARASEKGASARRVRQVVEIESVDVSTNKVNYNEVFSWDPAKDVFKKKKESIVLKKISEEKGFSMDFIQKEIQSRKKFLQWLFDQELDWKQFAEQVNLYRRNKEKALAAIKG